MLPWDCSRKFIFFIEMDGLTSAADCVLQRVHERFSGKIRELFSLPASCDAAFRGSEYKFADCVHGVGLVYRWRHIEEDQIFRAPDVDIGEKYLPAFFGLDDCDRARLENARSRAELDCPKAFIREIRQVAIPGIQSNKEGRFLARFRQERLGLEKDFLIPSRESLAEVGIELGDMDLVFGLELIDKIELLRRIVINRVVRRILRDWGRRLKIG